MKVLFLGFTKIKYMPYANFYLDNINSINNEIHFVYWNRNLKEEDLSRYANVSFFEFKYFQSDDVAKITKVNGFLKYKKFAKKIIKQNNYDLIIALHTFPAVLLRNVLIKKYKGKFIFDYRDSTYEKYSFFRKIIGRLVKNSKVTFVSSDAFRTLLPLDCEYKIITTHNISINTLKQTKNLPKESPNEIIRIAFWGFIRDKQLNETLIEKISKDPRFELHYYGREQQIALSLKNFAKSINAENVYFHGEYSPEDRYVFASKTDILHNMFDDNNMMLAMSNKYYDGIMFKIPQLCYQGSFMAQQVKEKGIGYDCDPFSEDFTSKVYKYYNSLNRKLFVDACNEEVENVSQQYKSAANIILTIGATDE